MLSTYSSLDKLLGYFKWYRKRRRGTWYKIKVSIPPSGMGSEFEVFWSLEKIPQESIGMWNIEVLCKEEN